MLTAEPAVWQSKFSEGRGALELFSILLSKFSSGTATVLLLLGPVFLRDDIRLIGVSGLHIRYLTSCMISLCEHKGLTRKGRRATDPRARCP